MNGKVSLSIGMFLGVALIGVLMFFYGYESAWRFWNIPTMSPCFADMRCIPGGLESRSLGFDPLVKNPGDPWGRPMNYPRVWLTLWASMNQSHVVYCGIALACLFFVSIFLFVPHTISNVTASILMVSIFSPNVLFGVERGNVDLLMFFLLSVAIMCINKEHTITKVIATVSLLTAFVLKLFPIFGIGLLLREKKWTVVKLGLFILSFVIIYSIVFYNDLMLIGQSKPRSSWFSYGVDILWMRANDHSLIFDKVVKVLSYVVVLICFAVVPYWVCSRKFGNTESIEDDKESINAFRVGSGIYIGTFLFGSNFDYRLIFLLFVIPQLMLWSKSSSKSILIISRCIIAGIIFSLWELAIRPIGPYVLLEDRTAILPVFLLDVFSSWVIFFGLLFLFSYSLPTWIKSFPVNLRFLLKRSS